MLAMQQLDAPEGRSFNIASQFAKLPFGIQSVLVVLVYFLLAVGGIILTRETGRIAWIWLPNAALLAVVLELEPPHQAKLMVAGFAGNLLANITVGDSLSNAIILSTFNTLEISICILCLKKACPHIDLGRPKHLLNFALIAGGLAPAIVGLLASTYLNLLFEAPFWPVFINWYGADALGMLLIAPFVLARIPNNQRTTEKESLTKPVTFAVLLLCGLVTFAVFYQSSYPLLFLVMLPLALAAFTTGVIGTALVTSVVALIAIGFTIYGTGPFALMQSELNIKVLVLQIFLVSCVLFGLSTAAVLTQQRLLKLKLVTLTKAAQQANEAKSEFLATVNHELRTPLTSIHGALGLLGGGAGGELPARARKLLAITESNCDRLILLVNDILEMEKIESGKFSLTITMKLLRSSLEELIYTNQSYLPQKQISIVLIDRAPKATVRVDEPRFQQALANLVANAIKFSPEQSIVQVIARYNGNKVRISVIDEGPGIPDHFVHKVFQKFEQADSGSTRTTTGTGLGLSISKALIELMDGTIDFRPNSSGGTEFFIDIPVVEAEEVQENLPKMLIFTSDKANALEVSSLAFHADWYADIVSTVPGLEWLIKSTSYNAIVVDNLLLKDGTTEQALRVAVTAAVGAKELPIFSQDEVETFLEETHQKKLESLKTQPA